MSERMKIFILIAIFVAFLIIGLKSDRTSTISDRAQSKKYNQIWPSQVTGKTIYLEGLGEKSKTVFVSVNEDAFELSNKYTRAKDTQGMLSMLLAEQVFEVPVGTKVYVVDCELSRAEIRILEGKHYGKYGWVFSEEVGVR